MSEKEPKDAKEKEVVEESVQLVEVPTQTGPAIKLPDGRVVSMEEYFAWLGDKIYHVYKNI